MSLSSSEASQAASRVQWAKTDLRAMKFDAQNLKRLRLLVNDCYSAVHAKPFDAMPKAPAKSPDDSVVCTIEAMQGYQEAIRELEKNAQRRLWLLAHLQNVDPLQAQVLILRFFDGLSYIKIAEKMHFSEGHIFRLARLGIQHYASVSHSTFGVPK